MHYRTSLQPQSEREVITMRAQGLTSLQAHRIAMKTFMVWHKEVFAAALR